MFFALWVGDRDRAEKEMSRDEENMCKAHEEMKRIAALDAVKKSNLMSATRMVSDGLANETILRYLSDVSAAELDSIRSKYKMF